MTLEEVAKRARVSTATVSRVLNDLEVVKESTRKRVLQALEDLNYHPNLHARTLAGGKSRSLGMIVSNVSNPFFVDVFHALDAAARRNGYDVLVEHTEYSVNQLIAGVRSLLGNRVAGLAVVVSEMGPSVIREVQASGLPAVFYDVGAPGPNTTNIRVRYELGMQRVVQYLYSLGHRRMGFVGHHAGLSPLQVRRKAFVDTVKQFGGEVEYKVVTDVDSPAGGMHATREMLAGGLKPTAIVCVNDYMAVGVLRESRAHGLSVPGDISITGFDNIEFSEFTNPALTTLNIPRGTIGQMAFEALMRKEEAPREILLDPELVVRDSTGPAPK
jgi:DNA-binding LacI/PurR family transcriptional regulator